MEARQWPKIYDLCHTFLDVASQTTHCHARMVVCYLTKIDLCNAKKRVTKSDTLGHCLMEAAISCK